ncbi:uncharacterized protein BO88DRAFT_444841 [Aspergillus vadensis CBS 113365]|uniref:Uncharacterized protein n=1 Tax=Aspergillus vadensis (strain CBS 113365 / IMI 142717 / IBT 24658) TaxID=1448311 RepID=A0A319CH72_ASPVC|nr:hypothetical protein BO88DRAFT_444841 [Aspergillus vadensis CBS 113365]PYH67602.1 hypothetical protein BO88DRAFT_444841 [Aspergillus vadensis CBS 113365]
MSVDQGNGEATIRCWSIWSMRSRQPWELLRTDDLGGSRRPGVHGVLTVMGRTKGKREREREREREERDRRYGTESQSVQSSVRAQKVCDAHPVTRWFERKQVKCERSVSQADGLISKGGSLPLDGGNALIMVQEIKTGDSKAVKPQAAAAVLYEPAWLAANWHGGLPGSRNYPVRCVGGLLSSGTVLLNSDYPLIAQLTVNLGCLRRRPTKWGWIAERRQPPSTESMDHTPPSVRWRADASCPVYKALYLSL